MYNINSYGGATQDYIVDSEKVNRAVMTGYQCWLVGNSVFMLYPQTPTFKSKQQQAQIIKK